MRNSRRPSMSDLGSYDERAAFGKPFIDLRFTLR
jgi:hypothetical protein